jgi:hypothetical protein
MVSLVVKLRILDPFHSQKQNSAFCFDDQGLDENIFSDTLYYIHQL